MENLTPMMAQYKAIKEKYTDCILMFRLGDFYEMFFEDAVEASKILQITLTSRNKGAASKAPMCGIPFHALEQYLHKLTRAGKKVAICDQVTEPTGKGIVERDVMRVVTPGTTFDENILDNKANNYVSAVVFHGERVGFAYADVTTGDFKVTELDNLKDFEAELSRVAPAELVCDGILLGGGGVEEGDGRSGVVAEILKRSGVVNFPFDYMKDSESELKKAFEVKSLSVFGLEGKDMAVEVSGILYEYLKETQKTDLRHVQKISYYGLSDFMPLDEACIRNLELFYTTRGKKEGSLISVLDNTVTSMGGRLIRNWLLHPLLKKNEIDVRLKKVSVFKDDSSLLRGVREVLNDFYDIERLLSRLSLGSGNARDLVAMKMSLKLAPEIKKMIDGRLENVVDDLVELSDLVELIERAISDEPPAIVRDGGMMKDGYNTELDDLRSISTEGKTFIKDLQERESKRTGVSSLKVKYNKVFGYYIEISKANLDSVPEDYIRKQTLVNAERFITPELKEYEEKVLTAEDRIKELEYELFYEVRMKVVEKIVEIQKIAKAVATIDVVSTFAFNAEKFGYCSPEVSENGEIKIVAGRHPVIEQIGAGGGGGVGVAAVDFVPNDCELDDSSNFMLITGPNMGGKSTYLRQVALITLMAQIGSFVPAQSAKIACVDRIFTRVGASDNLVRGESTFMVEMQEASYILNNATEQSLIILDEIGRGTSTYDGVSIAWAIMEFIHDQVKAKTLFATHYHELIELAEKLERSTNMSAYVRENEKEGVVFLYKIVSGGVDKSYGIEVAKLAGLPVSVVSRARGVLGDLENRHIQKSKIAPDQMGLFKGGREHSGVSKNDKNLLVELKGMDLNQMTPLDALKKLDEIKKRSNN